MIKRKYFFNMLVFAALSGGLSGYMLGVISGILPILENSYGFTSVQISLVAGSILLGCVIASIYTGVLNDYIGRKKVMIITFLLYIIGTLGFLFYSTFNSIYIFRLIQGIGFGMAVIVVPVYLSEVATKNNRGTIITTFQLSLTGGVLVSNLINLLLAIDLNWHLVVVIMLILCLVTFYYVFTLPESPRWLYNHVSLKDAKKALACLNEKFNNHLVWDEINVPINKEKVNVKEILTNKLYYKPILIVTAAVSLTQLSGYNAFIQCSVSILKDSGINSEIVGLLGGVSITAINFLATILTLILVERIGRKKILKIGTFTLLIVLLSLSFLNFALPTGILKGYITLLGIVLVVGFFAFGPGGVILVLCTELLPNQVRGIGLSIAFTIGGLVGMFFVSAFLPLSKIIGFSGLFLLIAFFTFCYVLISFIIPETKGKTLEEIEEEFSK